jgi:hypothetical protein
MGGLPAPEERPCLKEDRTMINRTDLEVADEDLVTREDETIYRPVTNRVMAVFDKRSDAEKAVSWLRDHRVPLENISVMTRRSDEPSAVGEPARPERADADAGSDVARGAGVGLAAGAGIGALFGLAAAAIPGIGPFITAGALAHALGAFGGGAVAGAIVGGTSGAVAGALRKWGLDKADADYYGAEIERGATFVAVDLTGTSLTPADVEEAFRRFGGRFRDKNAAPRSY